MRLCRDKYYFGLSIAALLISFIVYYITKAPTLSFWDCGEFIAASYILGVPHPPGYPVYIILGRLFTLLPIAGDIAVRVNLLSVLGGTASVFAGYWVIIRLFAGKSQKPSGLARIGLGIGALCGALIMGFSRTFWANAVEAEVYTLSMFLMLAITYLTLMWSQNDNGGRRDNLLILISYLAWFALGIHLTTFIIIIPAVIYLACIDFRRDGFRRWPVWAIMAFFVLYAVPLQTELPALVGIDITMYELESFIFLFLAVAIVVSAAAVISRIKRSETRKVWVLALSVMLAAVIGYSSQLYIPVRAARKPAINENNPSTWGRFKGFLERKQYGQESMIRRMFERRGSVTNQLAAHPRFGFLGIFNSQYASPDVKLTFFESKDDKSGRRTDFSISLAMIYILLLGLYGIYEGIRRSPPEGLFILSAAFLCTIGLVIYMNFSDGTYNPTLAPISEVRNRDYFYTPGFMYYSIIIGMGLAGLLSLVGRLIDKTAAGKKARVSLFVLTSLVAVALAGQTAAANFHHNDRRGNYLPNDYARNILDSCERDAVIFTNGDNDTFPLWYLQEVEGYRKDIRVVNLSLLNTSWYIHQLKYRMGVPIDLPDEVIDNMRPFRSSESGAVYRIQDQMVQHLVTNIIANGWKIPIYFAITVPDENRMGLDDHLVMEGMAYRLVETKGEDRVNSDVGMKIFSDPANFRGISDPSVRTDENDQRLILNYMVAMFEVAEEFVSRGEVDSAAAVARVAMSFQSESTPWQTGAYLAKILAASSRYDEISEIAEKSADGEKVFLAASQDLLRSGELDKAQKILEMTLARYPSSLAALNNLAAVHYQNGDSVAFNELLEKFRADNDYDPEIMGAVDQIVERLTRMPAIPRGQQ